MPKRKLYGLKQVQPLSQDLFCPMGSGGKSRGWERGFKGYQGRLQIMIVRKDCDVIYPLRLTVSFLCSSRFPRLNHHLLTIGFGCTSTISRKVFLSSLKLWKAVLLVQEKKGNGLIVVVAGLA